MFMCIFYFAHVYLPFVCQQTFEYYAHSDFVYVFILAGLGVHIFVILKRERPLNQTNGPHANSELFCYTL